MAIEWQKPSDESLSELKQTLEKLRDSALESAKILRERKKTLEKEFKDGGVE